MNQASNYTFLKKKKAVKKEEVMRDLIYQPEIDTNVISISFKNMKQAEENLQMGDPILCTSCNSCLSKLSNIFSKDAYKLKFYDNQDSEEKKEGEAQEAEIKNRLALDVVSENKKVWVCEFCAVHNLLEIETEEIPTKDDVVFMMKSASQIKSNKTSDSDISVIFCIDNSGSMSVTQEVQGKHDLKHGLSPEEYEMLKQFIEVGANQYLPNQKSNTTYVSRKQCVLAAIESQVVEMKGEFPYRKVGLVTFNDDVCVVGDGSKDPEIIAGDKLYKYDICQQIGQGSFTNLMSNPVKESADKLIKKFGSLKESGKTALGPALLVSVAMAAQGKPGSKVILCTDGLANIGLGELDSNNQTKIDEFYDSVAVLAKGSGVSVSIISIKGEGAKLDVIGKLADQTNGNLTRVDPNDITKNFANILKTEVLGTQVQLKLRLHKAFKFRNELPEFLREEGGIFEKDIGNVSAATELTFEYENRTDEELMKLGVNLDNLESVPFQAQISYTSTNGDKLLRVISQKQKTTHNLEQAEEYVNMNLMAFRGIQQQANFAHNQRYMDSANYANQWDDYMNNNLARKHTDKKSQEVLGKFNKNNVKIQSAVSNRIQRSEPMKAEFKSVEKDVKKEEKKGFLAGLFGGFGSKKSSIPESNKEDLVEDDEDAECEAIHMGKNMNSEF